MVGRLAAARTAVELGYGIRPDAGPSGRLGHWAIAGVPEAAMAALSKRTGEIEAAAGGGGWRARQIAARTTRKAKRRDPPSRLLPSWRAELTAAGHPAEDIEAGIDAARTARILEPPDGKPVPEAVDVEAVVQGLIAAEGPLAARKAWRTSDLVVAAAPLLYGCEPSVLEHVVKAVLGRREVLPLLGHADRERMYTLASTVAVEHAIAELAELCRGPSLSPAIPDHVVEEAIGGQERRGLKLTAGQADTVRHLCGSRRHLEIVIGHAGTGKTTALTAVREAYESTGWLVLGTSTSGQATRALEAEADIPSRTLASLRWQAEHGRIGFGRKTAIILDEAGMADDPDLLWLLGQVATAGGRLVMVGDHRQLDAVGPGGGLRAIIERGDAHQLDEVVRQANPAERRALAEVRGGDPAVATAFYRSNHRIHPLHSWDETMSAATDAWAGDVAQGRDTVLLAWRRADVDGLNLAARQRMAEVGRLLGPALVAGGRSYQAGDAVIALAPLANRSLVTSERATVTGVEPERGRLAVRSIDGRAVLLEAPDLAADRLAHGYAITVHRSQGATFDTAHVLAGGGDRHLAYVALSRARGETHIWCTADSIDQAVDDLHHDWTSDRRQRWAIDSGTPVSGGPAGVRVHAEPPAAVRLAALRAEKEAILAGLPRDPAGELESARRSVEAVEAERASLRRGEGPRATAAVRHLAEEAKAAAELRRAAASAASSGASRLDRWRARRDLPELRRRDAAFGADEVELETRAANLRSTAEDLGRQLDLHRTWHAARPEVRLRLHHLDRAIASLEAGEPVIAKAQPLAPAVGR